MISLSYLTDGGALMIKIMVGSYCCKLWWVWIRQSECPCPQVVFPRHRFEFNTSIYHITYISHNYCILTSENITSKIITRIKTIWYRHDIFYGCSHTGS